MISPSSEENHSTGGIGPGKRLLAFLEAHMAQRIESGDSVCDLVAPTQVKDGRFDQTSIVNPNSQFSDGRPNEMKDHVEVTLWELEDRVRKLQEGAIAADELLPLYCRFRQQINSAKWPVEEVERWLQEAALTGNGLRTIAMLCQENCILAEILVGWKGFNHLLNTALRGKDWPSALEILERIQQSKQGNRKYDNTRRKQHPKQTKHAQKGPSTTFPQLVGLVRANRAQRIRQTSVKAIFQGLKDQGVQVESACLCLAQAYRQNVWSVPEKRSVLEWLIGIIDEVIAASKLDSLKPLREQLMREASHGSEMLHQAQQYAFKSAQAQETKKSTEGYTTSTDNEEIELCESNVKESALHYLSLVEKADEQRQPAIWSSYSKNVNMLIEQTYSRPYSNEQLLVATILHSSNLLKLGSQHTPKQELKLDRHILRIIEELIKRNTALTEAFSRLEVIYRHFAADRELMGDHIQLVLEQFKETKSKGAAQALLVLSVHAQQAVVECQASVVAAFSEYAIVQVDAAEPAVNFLANIPSASTAKIPLVADWIRHPESYQERVRADVYLRFSQAYRIPLAREIVEKFLSHPTEALIEYLHSSTEGMKLLEEQRRLNWPLYKLHMLVLFKQAVETDKPITVGEVQFRGDLINDKPFVVEKVAMTGNSESSQQGYFMNLSGFLSVLYASLRIDALPNQQKFNLIAEVISKIKQLSPPESEAINQLYYQRLCWWRILTTLVAKAVRIGDIAHPVLVEAKDLAMRSLSRSVSPCIRQYYQLVLAALLSIDDGTLEAEMLSILERESKVSILGPLVLMLGYHLTKTNSAPLFRRLAIYIASHIAYVRGLAQYYCFQFYAANKETVEPSERPFFEQLSSYSVGNKDSRKLMKNIGKGVQSFKKAADNISDMRVILTVNYERVEQDAIPEDVYDLLEQDGQDFLSRIDCSKLSPGMRAAVQSHRLAKRVPVPFPSFEQYVPSLIKQIDTHHRQSEIIVVTSLLEKPPNFGHLLRTLSNYKYTTLVVPSSIILQDSECKEIYNEQPSTSVVEVKQKDMLCYLSVQKQRGYSIVALEQATRSVPLEKFQFPKKCVLVLGNQRLGMSSQIIDMADHLVEIEQFGKVRSLNVHVSSVLFLWSYHTSQA